MKHYFALLLMLYGCPCLLFAAGDEPPAKAEKKHHLNWLVEAQPVIGVGKFTSRQTIGGNYARTLRAFGLTTDSTFKFLNAMYLGSFKGSAGYQYKDIIYVGLGAGVQFGRDILADTARKVTNVMAPFFADLRVCWGKKVSFYFQQTTGYTLYFDQTLRMNDTVFLENGLAVYHDKTVWGGFFMQSSLGGKILIKKLALSAGVGYELSYIVQKFYGLQLYNLPYTYLGAENYPLEDRDMRHSITINLGLSF